MGNGRPRARDHRDWCGAGVLGTLIGTRSSASATREAESRARRADAAERFFRAAQLADHRNRDAAKYCIDTPEFRGAQTDFTPDRALALAEAAGAAGDEVQGELGSVQLYFGPDAAVTQAAGQWLMNLRTVQLIVTKVDDHNPERQARVYWQIGREDSERFIDAVTQSTA